jgi:hypothetical protein
MEGAKDLVIDVMLRLGDPVDAPWMHEEKPFVATHYRSPRHEPSAFPALSYQTRRAPGW